MIKKAPLVSGAYPVSPELVQETQKFAELVKTSKNILISSTLTSDGDSIGAQLGLYDLCCKLGAKSESISIIDESPVPMRYAFLKGSERIVTTAEWKSSKDSAKKFDLGIVCDGGVERTGNVQPLFENIPKRVLVDHHAVGSKLNYEARILDIDSSSSCELVYMIYEQFGFDVSPGIAESLFVGIVFDTGFFKHSLTSPRTHGVAARLVATGIDFSKISDRAILERSWEAQLLLKMLLQNAKRQSNGKLISSHWTHRELVDLKVKDGDQEGMINQLYYTEGSEVIALFVEKDDGEIKISFRSKGKINVAEFARSLTPEGGGHVRASGCTLKGDLKSVQADVLLKLDVMLK